MSLDPSDGFVAANGVPGVDELPIFSVEHVQLQFSISADFVAAQVANNVIILALSNGRILRIDLNRPEDIDGNYRVCAQLFDANRLIDSLPQILTCQRSPPRSA
jgi:hypothetical protein